MESDYKPMFPFMNAKHSDDLPSWVVRFWLRFAKYDYVADDIPGKLLYGADVLSHALSREEGDQKIKK